MGLKEWWESRQQKKQEHENEKLLELAEHPHDIDTSGTDIDDVKMDAGNSRATQGGELSSDEVHRIE
jgi:hypothetical protein